MNCAQCQTANSPEATYCRNCGAPVNQVGEPAYSGYQPPQGGYQEPPTNRYTPPQTSTPPPPPGQYNPPQGQYQPPQNGYQAPEGQYQSPQGGFPGGQYQPGQSGPVFGGKSALPPVRFDLGRLTRVDRIVAGATFVTMISIWLPWFSASYSGIGGTVSGSVSGTHLHGWLWLEFLLALALLAYLGARAAWEQLPVRVPVPHELLLAAATGLQFLLILIGFLARPSTDGLAGYSISWDFGAFLAIIASLVAAAPVVYPLVKSYADRRSAGAAPRY